MPEVILSAGGQRAWPKIRSNSPANQLFFSQRLPRKSMADKGLRCRNRQDSDSLDQQFFTNSKYNRGFVSLSLAAVAIFQMDQTTPPNKAIFWDFRKYRKDSIMDRSSRSCPSSYHQVPTKATCQPIYNITDFERNRFRKYEFNTGAFGQ